MQRHERHRVGRLLVIVEVGDERDLLKEAGKRQLVVLRRHRQKLLHVLNALPGRYRTVVEILQITGFLKYKLKQLPDRPLLRFIAQPRYQHAERL